MVISGEHVLVLSGGRLWSILIYTPMHRPNRVLIEDLDAIVSFGVGSRLVLDWYQRGPKPRRMDWKFIVVALIGAKALEDPSSNPKSKEVVVVGWK